MSRRKPTTDKKIADIVQEVIFYPTPAMREVKAKYTICMSENVLTDKPTLAAALQLTNDTRLQKWWSLPGFQEWFTNTEEFRQKAEMLSHLALDVLHDVLSDPTASNRDKLAAVRQSVEISGRIPKNNTVEKFLDAQIASMDKRQLEAYLRKHGALPGATSDDKKAEAEDTE